MSDHKEYSNHQSSDTAPSDSNKGQSESVLTDPLRLLDECLASMPQDDQRGALLYKMRHLLLQEGIEREKRDTELKKLNTVVEKLTAPANRIGTLLDLPDEGMARILVGGGEFYANVDPRIDMAMLHIGCQVLVNEAYVVIRSLGFDDNGPLLKIKEVLSDGRLRIEQEPGRPGVLLQRASSLKDVAFKTGDEVRVDPSQRLVIERLEESQTDAHLLDEVPSVTWEQIGGQQDAIKSIRRAIEYPLLHTTTFQQYEFTQPKGFLLHGPPGCGKTLIGKATAGSLAKLVGEVEGGMTENGVTDQKYPPITQGAFLHVKGPEVLNMWVGESERIVRELFAKARERRKAGFLPFIFIDEAESILGTRRAARSYNISNTLVPMFCTELDGIESLHDVVVILASNRPDLIDPAVLRPGRIDRKVKVSRPNRTEAEAILQIYLTENIPLAKSIRDEHQGDPAVARKHLLSQILDALFVQSDENRVLSIRLRNGRRETLYRSDLLSGAILAGIVRRAKERAVERIIEGDAKSTRGITVEDFQAAVTEEFKEGEILPPDDSAEEWLKLLDHHPDQVVGISSFRRGSTSVERTIHSII